MWKQLGGGTSDRYLDYLIINRKKVKFNYTKGFIDGDLFFLRCKERFLYPYDFVGGNPSFYTNGVYISSSCGKVYIIKKVFIQSKVRKFLRKYLSW